MPQRIRPKRSGPELRGPGTAHLCRRSSQPLHGHHPRFWSPLALWCGVVLSFAPPEPGLAQALLPSSTPGAGSERGAPPTLVSPSPSQSLPQSPPSYAPPYALPRPAEQVQVGQQVFVLGSKVNLRVRPELTSAVTVWLPAGTPVQVLELRTQPSSESNKPSASGEGGRKPSPLLKVQATSGEIGWIPQELVSVTCPSLEGFLALADQGNDWDRVQWLLRARELEPWRRDVAFQLQQAWQGVGDNEQVRKLEAQLNLRADSLLGSCFADGCEIWGELKQGQLMPLQPEGRSVSAQKQRIARVNRETYFPVEIGGAGGYLQPDPGQAREVEGRVLLPNTLLTAPLLLSRIPPTTLREPDLPELKSLEPRVVAWIVETGTPRPPSSSRHETSDSAETSGTGETSSETIIHDNTAETPDPPGDDGDGDGGGGSTAAFTSPALPDREFTSRTPRRVTRSVAPQAGPPWQALSRTGAYPLSDRVYAIQSLPQGWLVCFQLWYDLQASAGAPYRRHSAVIFGLWMASGELQLQSASPWLTDGQAPVQDATFGVHADLDGDQREELLLFQGATTGAPGVAQLEVWGVPLPPPTEARSGSPKPVPARNGGEKSLADKPLGEKSPGEKSLADKQDTTAPVTASTPSRSPFPLVRRLAVTRIQP